ncbi:lysozyme inhibitor LprI family protein [uncultured Sphingomonas sp.]|uniref:lysozyme inhibitor LprI family protein n=1 Tax=uncultured Sphingomonas sp. TaxID=158754 RepID=UPI003749B801
MGMQSRTRAAHEVANANLEQAITDLHLVISEDEGYLLEKAQELWRAYRDALARCAYCEYEGGTHAPLAAGLAGLTETERRTAEIRSQVQERVSR